MDFGPDQYIGGLPNEYKQYNTTYGGQKETIGWKWWDTQTYVSGTTLSLPSFFNTRATPDLSNMKSPFQIPSPSAFLCRAVRFFVKQRPTAASAIQSGSQLSAVDNIAQLINTGVFTLTIGDKLYNQEPIWCVTSGGGAYGTLSMGGTLAVGTAYSYAQNGVPDPRAVNALTKPLFIPPMLNFSGTATWPAALTLTGNVDITFLLDGDLIRPVQ